MQQQPQTPASQPIQQAFGRPKPKPKPTPVVATEAVGAIAPEALRKREHRHREQAISDWLRSLTR